MTLSSPPNSSLTAECSATESVPGAGTALKLSERQALKRMADCLADMAGKGCLPFHPGDAAQDTLQHFANLGTHEVLLAISCGLPCAYMGSLSVPTAFSGFSHAMSE